MVNQNLIHSLEDEDIERQLGSAFSEYEDIDLGDILFPPEAQSQNYSIDSMVKGTIVRIDNDHVIVDVGFKSEATIPSNEWTEEDPPEVGQVIDVLIEDLEDAQGRADDPSGLIAVSKKRADQRKIWDDVISKITEGDIVTGKCQRKIKGGLLVDIGVSVFLPASQVDIRRPGDIGDYIDRVVQCEVLKIDDVRKNIVVSRRSLIEKERTYAQQKLMADLEKGQVRKGVVKNIADFGAFVDLGGIDGLLHITDMSHTRISKPSEMVKMDQEIDVMILNVDREKVKIALGLKQLLPNPWDHVEEKYPVGSVQNGEVVNVLPYGAFVKLEPGIEGLVHISEMSWVKRVNHPNELVQTGDEIKVSVLKIDRQGEQMSLGMKQTQDNPWDKVEENYPIGREINGRVRNLTNYGAFIELEEGIDGLLHVSDMSWTRKISHPNEVLEKGQELSCKILAVDIERHRIALGLKQMNDDPWSTDIPDRYQPGQLIKGKITKITNFGVFVGLEDGLEGLLHISELSDDKVENPEELVKVGEEVEVKVLRVDTDERKIGLSKRRVGWSAEQEAAAMKEEGIVTGTSSSGGQNVPASELKGGLGDSGPLIKPAAPAEDSE
ncbi:30S ribosomal protein S1 [Mariniblastus fucicola]|uniref:Small ribosomal subunit protein bS1 n=1 Tax=Mariniblastus fucicola TaxID=980251 RepID=A0A5B9PBN4_9BACT|nr:30S ribosomal protein S1 [Mariniblastus fucicola]QEG21896.1 30S ribosomal protein S1 [Mariniblastus fucicola]